jgi:glycerophosphoryl diester phosphodiesterase
MAIAHRGGAALAPENTLRAFRVAASLGFRYIETDVRATRDGHLVCFHDATVDRVTGAHGRLNRYRASVLARLRVDGVEPVPTLAEALDEFPHCNFTLDVKEAAVIGPLADLLRKRRDIGRVCVAAAWDGWLDRLRALVPGVQTAMGWRSLTAFVCRSRAGTRPPRRFGIAPFAHIPLRVGSVPIFFDRLVADAHNSGVRIVVWTVDEPAAMHWLLDVGVDGIITDRPDLLREVLIARGGWRPVGVSPVGKHDT